MNDSVVYVGTEMIEGACAVPKQENEAIESGS